MPDHPAGVARLSGAAVVLPDRVARGVTLVIADGRIVDLAAEADGAGAPVELAGHTIVPGFVDAHVHGVAGVDVMDRASAVAEVAAVLPRFGVTAFRPTAVACEPAALDAFLSAVAAARRAPAPASARVLPAHYESNFIAPDYRGAQPADCLCGPAVLTGASSADRDRVSARDVVATIDRHRGAVGVVTLAPELEGALQLVRAFTAGGVRVSLGHSGATYEEAMAAIAAGACQATHLFNRMPPMTHREPGLAGAVLESDAVVAEIVGDLHHVHPAMLKAVVAAKGAGRVMAITDGTAGAGLPAGATAALGGRPITVAEVARLADGTTAGSVATMDRVFANLVEACGIGLVEAVTLCTTTPARQAGLDEAGVIAPGARADLVVLDSSLRVAQTWIGGRPVRFGTPGTGGSSLSA